MSTQLTIDLDQTKSRVARDAGILKAVTSADAACPGWSEKAYDMFKEWLSGWPVGYKFLIEDFRKSAEIRGLESPPSARAFGQIPVRARKEGLIIAGLKIATRSVTAHKCFATQWIKA